MPLGQHPRVFCSSRRWALSGVNVFAANLIRGLCARGFDARMLLPTQSTSANGWAAIPADMPVTTLPWRVDEGGITRWRKISRVLKESAPCVYLPGYDWFCAWKSLSLRPAVRVLGVLHSDEACYYNLAAAIGDRMDGVVAVTTSIAEEAVRRQSALTGRVTTIPYGVDCPTQYPHQEHQADQPLTVVYAGRLAQRQKRIFDIPSILEELDRLQVPVDLTIVGDGDDGKQLTEQLSPWIDNGKTVMRPALNNAQILDVFAQSDIFLLTSAFEGLPVALLEAMSRGCVPVVSATRSGAPQVVDNGNNGFLVPIGNVKQYAQRIANLHHNRNLLKQLSLQAFATIRSGEYLLDRMCDRYAHLITELTAVRDGDYPTQPPVPLSNVRELNITYRDFVPSPLIRLRRALVSATPLSIRLRLRQLRKSV